MRLIQKNNFLSIIEVLFLTLILNMNIVRTIIGIDQSIIYYLIYFMYVFTFFLHKFQFKNHIKISRFSLVIGFIIIYSFILCIPELALDIWIKLVLSIAIGIRTFFLSKIQIIKVLRYTIGINILFSLVCIFEFNFIFSRISNNTENYLNVSLPIAFSCNIVSTVLLLGLIIKNKKKYIISFFILVMGLIRFSARGNIIFILINIIIISLMNLFIKSRKSIKKVIISFLFCIFIIFSYFNFASDYDINRMNRIFTNINNEPRMILYAKYISHLCKYNFISIIFGQGLHSSYNVVGIYPHNMFLEIFGELGLTGILSVFIFLIQMLKNMFSKIVLKNLSYIDKRYILLGFSCFTFYLLIFNKSYSIYDGYQLFICIAILLNFITNVRLENNIKEIT